MNQTYVCRSVQYTCVPEARGSAGKARSACHYAIFLGFKLRPGAAIEQESLVSRISSLVGHMGGLTCCGVEDTYVPGTQGCPEAAQQGQREAPGSTANIPNLEPRPGPGPQSAAPKTGTVRRRLPRQRAPAASQRGSTCGISHDTS